MNLYTFLYFNVFLISHITCFQNIEKQGIITFEITQNNQKNKCNIYYKNENIRIDFYLKNQIPEHSLLINTTQNVVYELNNTKKSYRIVNPITYCENNENYKFSEKKISQQLFWGYSCENWFFENSVSSKRIEYKVVSSSDFTFLSDIIKYIDKENVLFKVFSLWVKKNNSFPILATEFDKNGNILSKAEVVNLQKCNIEDNIFQIDKSFKKW